MPERRVTFEIEYYVRGWGPPPGFQPLSFRDNAMALARALARDYRKVHILRRINGGRRFVVAYWRDGVEYVKETERSW